MRDGQPTVLTIGKLKFIFSLTIPDSALSLNGGGDLGNKEGFAFSC